MSEYESKVLIAEPDIQARIKEIASCINEEYADKNLLLVCVLLGAIPTTAELMKHINLPDMQLDVMRVKSYSGQESNRAPELLVDLSTPAEGRNIIVVEDITDTRHTIAYIRKTLESRNPASFKVFALLNKADRQEVDTPVDIIGFEIPDKWVENFGLDTDGLKRGGPHVTYRSFNGRQA